MTLIGAITDLGLWVLIERAFRSGFAILPVCASAFGSLAGIVFAYHNTGAPRWDKGEAALGLDSGGM